MSIAVQILYSVSIEQLTVFFINILRLFIIWLDLTIPKTDVFGLELLENLLDLT